MKMTILLFMVVTFNVFGTFTYSYGHLDTEVNDAAINIFLENLEDRNISDELQQNKITGTVTDEKGNPLPGVTVVVKGTRRGTTTDINGNYIIEADNAQSVLVFSFIGYKIQEVTVGSRAQINITLLEEVIGLEEVVVVGYGTQSRRNVTGSVASANMKKIETLPLTNISQAFRGTVAGVQFTDNGRPGQGGTILIRGTRSIKAGNNPLIILDGAYFNATLNDINPNDILSMEILKDASATAIYGSRAANGVILITSKRGIAEKPVIRFSTYYAVQDWSKKTIVQTPERYRQRFLDFRKQTGLESDPSKIESYLTASEAENYRNNKTVDGWDYISQNSSIQSYDINVGGQTKSTNYFFSASSVKEKGLVYNDNANRISLRTNIETNITNWLKVGMNSMYSKRDLSGVEASTGEAYSMSPYATLYLDEEETELAPFPVVEDPYNLNPLFDALNNKNEEIYNNLFGVFYTVIDIPFIKGLSYKLNYSPNYRWEHNYNFTPRYVKNFVNNIGTISKSHTERLDWVLENIVNYSKKIGANHFFDITLLYGQNSSTSSSTTSNGSDLFNDVNGWNNLVIAKVQTISSSAQKVDGISSMFRINYRFKEKYLATITGRRDGASVFGLNNKYAILPSVALAWIASDENFIKSISWIDNLKLRLSHGATGNQAISPYQSLDRSSTTQYVFGDGGATSVGVYPSTMPNYDLTWETTLSSNIAIDFGILKNRVNGTVELYNMKTKDLLLARSLPSMTGFASTMANLGEVNNRGIELTLNTVNIKTGKFSWNSGLVFSYDKNKIVHLYYSDINKDGVEDDDLGNRWFIGQPVNINYDYVFDGIFQEGDEMPAGYKPGFVRLKDLNGDGKYTPDADRKVLSQKEPKYRLGFTNNFQYGNWNLSVFVNSLLGWSMSFPQLGLNTNIGAGNYPQRPLNYIDAGWWTEENKSNTRPSWAYYNDVLGHSYYVSRDFVRIQDVSLSYTVPASFLEKYKIISLNVYLSAKNLFIFEDYPGFDPESGSSASGFPTPRVISLGLSASF